MDMEQLEIFAEFVRDSNRKYYLAGMTARDIVDLFLETNPIMVINRDDVLRNAQFLRDPGDGPTGFALAAGFSAGCLFMEDKIYNK